MRNENSGIIHSDANETRDPRAARQHADGTPRLGIPNGPEGIESGYGEVRRTASKKTFDCGGDGSRVRTAPAIAKGEGWPRTESTIKAMSPDDPPKRRYWRIALGFVFLVWRIAQFATGPLETEPGKTTMYHIIRGYFGDAFFLVLSICLIYSGLNPKPKKV
jgi:hypothetical protein